MLVLVISQVDSLCFVRCVYLLRLFTTAIAVAVSPAQSTITNGLHVLVPKLHMDDHSNSIINNHKHVYADYAIIGVNVTGWSKYAYIQNNNEDNNNNPLHTQTAQGQRTYITFTIQVCSVLFFE